MWVRPTMGDAVLSIFFGKKLVINHQIWEYNTLQYHTIPIAEFFWDKFNITQWLSHGGFECFYQLFRSHNFEGGRNQCIQSSRQNGSFRFTYCLFSNPAH